jgi:hypothetical protein
MHGRTRKWGKGRPVGEPGGPASCLSISASVVAFKVGVLRAVCALVFLAGASLPAATTSLLPAADAYLRSDQAATAFGTASTIEANNANGVRVMLLRFDLRSIPEPVTGLKLELTAVTGSAGNQFQIYGLIGGENWPENTVTWATAPGVIQGFTSVAGTQASYLKSSDLRGAGAALAIFDSAASGPVTAFDVSYGPLLDFVNADADKIVTLLIAEADPSDNPGDRFHSREATSGKPTLTVTTGTTPQVGPSLVRVIIVAGQSNADGRGEASGLPTAPVNLQAPQPNVPFYYHTFNAPTNVDGTLGRLTTLRPGATQSLASVYFGPEVTLGQRLGTSI